MTNESTRKIWGIVVTHQPDLARLDRVLEAVRPQLDGLMVVDNGSNAEVVRWLRAVDTHTELALVAHGENRGLAAGHNTGI
ncbi:MAG: hypothetical protein ABIU95_08660, partial [Burkholderiales bacterium]